MPAPLLELLLQLATDAERAAIEEALAERVWSGPDQPTPNPATERRLRPRTQADSGACASTA